MPADEATVCLGTLASFAISLSLHHDAPRHLVPHGVPAG
jgi:hypothetical protein